MPGALFPVLLEVLQDGDNVSADELATITFGHWTFEHVPALKTEAAANKYRRAALALHKRACVVIGSSEWLVWFKSPQGRLHACLTARLIEWDEKRPYV